MSDGTDLTVRVSQRFPHTPETVFDGWLDPALARRFMFTIGADELVRCDMNPREGGTFVMTGRLAAAARWSSPPR